MDRKKFEKQLAKLNKLYATIVEDGDIGEIEKDFLKSYLMGLYETISEGQVKKEEKAKVEKEPEPKPSPEPAKKAAEVKAVKEEKPEEIVAETPEVPEVKEAEIKKEAVEVVKPKVKEVPVAGEDGESMEALFGEFSSKDLGDKLSQIAIPDLTKAWSINEKIFTIKELFAGDSEKFRQTVRELNDLNDFEAAKTHLLQGVANEYGWQKEGKFKKARNFIKLIKRRYN